MPISARIILAADTVSEEVGMDVLQEMRLEMKAGRLFNLAGKDWVLGPVRLR